MEMPAQEHKRSCLELQVKKEAETVDENLTSSHQIITYSHMGKIKRGPYPDKGLEDFSVRSLMV